MADGTERAAEALSRGFLELYPAEAARVVDNRPQAEIIELLQSKPVPLATAVFQRMTPDVAAGILPSVESNLAGQMVAAMDPAQAAAILARVDEEAQSRLLESLEPSLTKELRLLMSFPEDSAGSLMDPRVITFHPESTVKEARARIRGLRGRQVYDIFLVNADGLLAGVVPLQEIVLARPNSHLEDLSVGAPASVHAMSTREEVVELLNQRRLTTLAVVDLEQRLLGVIRHDALVAAAQEEMSADIQTMVGVSKEERALSKASFAVRKRLPWLQINLATAFLAAAVVGLFEDTIARFTALAVLLPVVAGQSGNTGAQALAVTMRGLALREIRLHHWLRISFKEVNVAAINGIAVALTTAAGVYVWSQSMGLALVIMLSMVISMVAAGLAGAIIPMILTAVGQDPAQSSSIILTTVTDVVGFLSFLGIATLLAGMLPAG
ncbi:MAG: magnesium transporter [Candidatus Binatia bacterium]